MLEKRENDLNLDKAGFEIRSHSTTTSSASAFKSLQSVSFSSNNESNSAKHRRFNPGSEIAYRKAEPNPPAWVDVVVLAQANNTV